MPNGIPCLGSQTNPIPAYIMCQRKPDTSPHPPAAGGLAHVFGKALKAQGAAHICNTLQTWGGAGG